MTTSVKLKKKQSVVAGKRMPLYLQVIYRRKVKRIILDYQLSPEEWIAETETINLPYGEENHRIEYLLQVRMEVEQKRRLIQRIIRKLEEENQLSLERIVSEFFASTRPVGWLQYMSRFIEHEKKKKAASTIRNYQSTLNVFRDFLQNKDIPVTEIDHVLLKSFEEYLLNRSLASNTVSFYCRTLRTVWYQAVNDGVIEPQVCPFRGIHTATAKTKKRAIDEKTLEKLKNLHLEDCPNQEFALDLFLFCYYARGMTFIDLAHLTRKNIKGKTLTYTRKKTGQVLTIEILPIMEALIRKYQKKGQFYLFPILKGENPTFKEYDSALRLQNKRLGKIGKKIGCYLSTYVARHTWASIANQKGIPIEIISESMGHDSLKTTMIYIATLDFSRIHDANRIVVLGKCNKRGMYRYSALL